MPSLRTWLQVLWAALTSGSTQAFYDRIAGVYDTVFQRHSVHADVMMEAVREYMPCADDGAVIDLACGTGLLTERLAEAGYSPIGIDFSEASLRVLQARLPRVHVVQADAERLALASGCASAVLCLGSWRHFSNPDAVASEIARVLRPGGFAIIGYFPPAFGGVFQLRDSWLRVRIERVYDYVVKLAGYSDRTSSTLEYEAKEILRSYFRNVRSIPSGSDCQAVFAQFPLER